MTGTDLVRLASSVLWELRAAWASGRRVSVTLERADVARVEGHVGAVSATGASVCINGLMVPMDRVLAVHQPSRLGDSEGCVFAWHGAGHRVEQIPGQHPLEGLA